RTACACWSSTCAATRAGCSQRRCRSPTASCRRGGLWGPPPGRFAARGGASPPPNPPRRSACPWAGSWAAAPPAPPRAWARAPSAPEVGAGPLKDNQRALLIGKTTYGKGSIQSLIPLQVGGGVRLTLARFYTPRGQPFAGVGVTPHIFEPRRDSQLEMAFEQAARLLAMK